MMGNGESWGGGRTEANEIIEEGRSEIKEKRTTGIVLGNVYIFQKKGKRKRQRYPKE
jgi:hypothetical protein